MGILLTKSKTPSPGGHRGISHKRITLCVVTSLLFAGTVVGIRTYRYNYVPIAYPTANIPDAAKYGDPERAVQQSYQLLAALRAADWEWSEVPKELCQLPDQKIAEDPVTRSKGAYAFIFTHLSNGEDKPMANKVAFYTDLYTRKNTAWMRGDRSTMQATGFYIVGWKDGRVTTVPIEEARTHFLPGGGGCVVFPGTDEWQADGFQVASIEMASGQAKTFRQKEFIRQMTVKDDIQACRTNRVTNRIK